MECEVRVLRGLPLVADFTIQPSDYQVGILGPYVEEIILKDRNGKQATWAELQLSKEDWDDVAEQCWNYMDTKGDYYA